MTDNELEQWRDGGYPDRAQFRAIIEAALSARAQLAAVTREAPPDEQARFQSEGLPGTTVLRCRLAGVRAL